MVYIFTEDYNYIPNTKRKTLNYIINQNNQKKLVSIRQVKASRTLFLRVSSKRLRKTQIKMQSQ